MGSVLNFEQGLWRQATELILWRQVLHPSSSCEKVPGSKYSQAYTAGFEKLKSILCPQV